MVATNNRHRSSFHAAVIYKGKRVFGIGINTMKTHPRQSRASGGLKPYLHAETSAIIDAGKLIDSRSKILVVRIGKDGKLMYSRPCNICMAEIVKVGIRKVIYSTGKGFREETVR